MNIIYKNAKLFAMVAVMMAMVGCNNEENSLGDNGDMSFEIISSDFECVSGQEQVVSVPAEGYMYSFMVDATEATSWMVSVEGGAWLTVNPVAKQKGNGEIIIKASENSYNESNRTSLVKITNTANDDVYIYRFNQEYDADYIRPEYEYFSYTINKVNQEMTFKVEDLELSGNVTCETLNDYDESDIKNYSLIYETECEKLGSEHYGDLKYENNTLSVTFNNSINSLNPGCYILPVTLKQDGVSVSRVWIVVNIYGVPTCDELPQLQLSANDLYLSSWRYTLSNIINNLIDGNLQTRWETDFNKNVNRHFDEKYGVYIDVTLPKDNNYKYIAFNYATGNSLPHMPYTTQVYIAESKEELDKKELEPLFTYTDDRDILPRPTCEWFITDKADIPVYSIEGLKVNVVRIAILNRFHGQWGGKPAAGDQLTDTDWNVGGPRENEGSAPCVIASEIAIFAK